MFKLKPLHFTYEKLAEESEQEKNTAHKEKEQIIEKLNSVEENLKKAEN